MKPAHDQSLTEYYNRAGSWADDRQQAASRSQRIAWVIAGIASAIALLEAFALLALIPLKREVPYTLLVDRQTGFVQALRPLEDERITADAALTRSFLVQYVIARESYARDTLQANYHKVGLFSADEARSRYLSGMQANNPQSPLALPARTTIDVSVRSVSSLSPQTALVRFSTIRADPGAQPQTAQHWAAVLTFRYSDAEMSAADRLINPLGFQVTRYRRDAETLPESVVEDRQASATLPLRSRSPAQ